VHADVTQPGGAEQRVDHGVGQHVGVGVPVEPELAFERDAAEHERPTGDQPVGVVADAGAHAHGPIGSRRRSRRSNTASSRTPSPSSSSSAWS
jgi:hypothetical protein